MKDMKTSWKPEIEKKYRLKDATEAEEVIKKAHEHSFKDESWTLQKDWIPDFEDFLMKKMGILLRIRTMEYISGSGPKWLLTLKIKQKNNGVHYNRELEISSSNRTNTPEVISFISDNFGIKIDLERLVGLDEDYLREVKLTEHRMYLEKRRRQYRDDNNKIILAIDELPEPAGWFAEIESEDAAEFSRWESMLGLDNVPIEEQDYGEIVKELTSEKTLTQQRWLAFSNNGRKHYFTYR